MEHTKKFATSQIHDQQMPNKYCHLFSLQYYFLVEHSSNILYLLSIDCYYLFWLIHHNNEINASMGVHHIFLAEVLNINHSVRIVPVIPYADHRGGEQI
jgi:hypothetical protein